MRRWRKVGRVTQLSSRYLLQQRKRTLLAIIAVIMSVALVTAAGILGRSIRGVGVVNIKQRFGSFYVTVEGVDEDDLELLREHVLVDSLGSDLLVGTVSLSDNLIAGVRSPDAVWREATFFDLVEGRIPRHPGEIALERWFLRSAGRDIRLGESVRLPITLAPEDDRGEGPERTREETMQTTVSKVYTVVGFLKPNPAAMNQGVASMVVCREEAATLAEGELSYTVGFITRHEVPIQSAVSSVVTALSVDADRVHENTLLLAAMGESSSDQADRAIRTVEFVVTAVILLATIAVIYNAFTISVLERIRQFGILRTVGATPRQIRSLVLREALFVGSVGALLGLGAGILAVRIIILVFNGFSGGVGFAGLSMTYPVRVLVGEPLLGIGTVCLSAIIPAFRAGGVSPIEAVFAEGRFISERVRRRKPGFAARLLGVSGRMAVQNLRRNPGRVVVTVISIGIGIVLFIGLSGLMDALEYAAVSFDLDPLQRDVSVRIGDDSAELIGESDRTVIDSLPGVTRTFGIHEVVGYIVLPKDEIGDVPGDLLPENPEEIQGMTGLDGTVIEMSLAGLDSAGLKALRPHVTRGYRSPETLAEMQGVYLPEGLYEIGDRVPVVVGTQVLEISVAGYLDNLPVSVKTDSPIVLPVSEETVNRITGLRGYHSLSIEVEQSTNPDDVYRAVSAVMRMRDDVRVYNLAEAQESQRSIKLQFAVLLYGLVAVVILIGAVNIVNTITTNLILRIREFGILRAVGMSTAQLKGMVRIESFFYGLYALVAGGTIGTIISFFINWSIRRVQDIPWHFPWIELPAAFLAVVAICLLSAAVPMGRIIRMDIVKSIQTTE
jgi:putative ABC transport system permease protein